jgi:hypothetical protein
MFLSLTACSSTEPVDLIGGLAVSDAVIEGHVLRVVQGKGGHPDRLVIGDARFLWDGENTVDGSGNVLELPPLPRRLNTVQNLQDVPESAVGRKIVVAVAYVGSAEGERSAWQIEYSLESETMEPHPGRGLPQRELERSFAADEDSPEERRAAFVELTIEAANELRAKNLKEPKPTDHPRLDRVSRN